MICRYDFPFLRFCWGLADVGLDGDLVYFDY